MKNVAQHSRNYFFDMIAALPRCGITATTRVALLRCASFSRINMMMSS
jgi:hypothetical protein